MAEYGFGGKNLYEMQQQVTEKVRSQQSCDSSASENESSSFSKHTAKMHVCHDADRISHSAAPSQSSVFEFFSVLGIDADRALLLILLFILWKERADPKLLISLLYILL